MHRWSSWLKTTRPKPVLVICAPLSVKMSPRSIRHGLWSIRSAAQACSRVLSFDARFGEEALTKLYRMIGRVHAPLIGCSPVQTRLYWPSSFQQLGGLSAPARMCGTTQSFKFCVWTSKKEGLHCLRLVRAMVDQEINSVASLTDRALVRAFFRARVKPALRMPLTPARQGLLSVLLGH